MSDPRSAPSRTSYLKQAEQAEALARRASSEQERASFEDIARLWRQLAERTGQMAQDSSGDQDDQDA